MYDIQGFLHNDLDYSPRSWSQWTSHSSLKYATHLHIFCLWLCFGFPTLLSSIHLTRYRVNSMSSVKFFLTLLCSHWSDSSAVFPFLMIQGGIVVTWMRLGSYVCYRLLLNCIKVNWLWSVFPVLLGNIDDKSMSGSIGSPVGCYYC